MKKRVLLASLFLAFTSLVSLSPVVTYADYDFISQTTETIYDTKNGLLTINTNDICQTESGYIYLVQYTGLTKYNGIKFELMQSCKDENGKHYFFGTT